MDFADLLTTGDSLSSVTSVTGDPSGLTIGTGFVSGTEVRFTVAGGTDAETYHIEVVAVTTNAETLEGDGYLYVTDTPEYEREFNYNYTALRTAIADYLGMGRNTEGTGTSWSDTDAYRLDAIIKSALAKVYYPNGGHIWSWLRPTSTLTTTAPYDTGTVTIVDGVVTLSGGTFPSWSAQGEIAISSGVYTVSTRDSNTQVTLTDVTVDASAGTDYTLRRYLYDLPTDFSGFEGQLTYAASQSVIYPPIENVSDSTLRRHRQQWDETDRPRYVAIRPKTLDTTLGQRWQAAFFPAPDAAYVLEYRYRVEPQMLSDAYPNPYGGPDIGELILEMCLAVAEQRYRDERGLHTQEAEIRLAAAIEHDIRSYSPDVIGYNADNSDGAVYDRFTDVATHSYEGTVYYDRNP
jgi:hypothetical protein